METDASAKLVMGPVVSSDRMTSKNGSEKEKFVVSLSVKIDLNVKNICSVGDL